MVWSTTLYVSIHPLEGGVGVQFLVPVNKGTMSIHMEVFV